MSIDTLGVAVFALIAAIFFAGPILRGYRDGRRDDQPATVKRTVVLLEPAGGRYGIDVVGESHYQKALERLASKRRAAGENLQFHAHLAPEPENRHDANAVRVDIDGHTVGYLARADAAIMTRQLKRMGQYPTGVAAKAILRGGGGGYSYGVQLDFEFPGD